MAFNLARTEIAFVDLGEFEDPEDYAAWGAFFIAQVMAKASAGFLTLGRVYCSADVALRFDPNVSFLEFDQPSQFYATNVGYQQITVWVDQSLPTNTVRIQ